MNRVGVPSTWPEARPLPASRRIRSATAVLARSRSNAATSRPSWAAYPRRSPSSSAFCRWNSSSCMSQNRPCQRKMPEREPHVPAELLADQLDSVERLPRVRALVVAVLDDQRACGRTADVIDFLVQRRQGQLAVVRYRVEGHEPPPRVAGGFGWLAVPEPNCRPVRETWMRPGSSWWISRILPTWLCCP